VGVHHVDRHLHRIESELVRGGRRQHLHVNLGALVSGKSDVSDLAGLFRIRHRLHGSSRGENAVRIARPDDLVELHQVHIRRLQPFQGFIDLPSRRCLVPPIDLGHEKRLVPVPVLQSFAHADLTRPVVIIPTVIHEIDPAIQRRTDDLDAVGLKELSANMRPAQANVGHLLTSGSKRAVGNAISPLRFRRKAGPAKTRC